MKYYLDTEFDRSSLLSLALVRDDGESVYYVFSDRAYDEWVQENVVPILGSCPVEAPAMRDKTFAAMDIAYFLKGDPDPVVITDWPTDIQHLCELITFPRGQMAPIHGLKFELHRVDAYPTTLEGAVQHNAWWDAMALREKLKAAK